MQNGSNINVTMSRSFLVDSLIGNPSPVPTRQCTQGAPLLPPAGSPPFSSYLFSLGLPRPPVYGAPKLGIPSGYPLYCNVTSVVRPMPRPHDVPVASHSTPSGEWKLEFKTMKITIFCNVVPYGLVDHYEICTANGLNLYSGSAQNESRPGPRLF